jgi:hypoxanthine phosphoribosyltransferase
MEEQVLTPVTERSLPQMDVVLSAEQIRRRVKELANEIDRDFMEDTPVLIGMLKGSFIFVADLCRAMTIPHHIDFMAVAAYGAGMAASGSPKLLKDLTVNITGRSVLIVEDIVDTGGTLSHIRRLLTSRQPRRLASVALLDKRTHEDPELPIEYVGFKIEGGFVVGYGLDLAERYRHLPFIGRLNPTQTEENDTRV